MRFSSELRSRCGCVRVRAEALARALRRGLGRARRGDGEQRDRLRLHALAHARRARRRCDDHRDRSGVRVASARVQAAGLDRADLVRPLPVEHPDHDRGGRLPRASPVAPAVRGPACLRLCRGSVVSFYVVERPFLRRKRQLQPLDARERGGRRSCAPSSRAPDQRPNRSLKVARITSDVRCRPPPERLRVPRRSAAASASASSSTV